MIRIIWMLVFMFSVVVSAEAATRMKVRNLDGSTTIYTVESEKIDAQGRRVRVIREVPVEKQVVKQRTVVKRRTVVPQQRRVVVRQQFRPPVRTFRTFGGGGFCVGGS